MKLITAIQEFWKIKNEVESELFWNFLKIMYEVEIQDTKSLLSPPLLETMEVKWRVKNPQKLFTISYHYITLGFENSRLFKEQKMALYQYQRRIPHDLFSQDLVNKDLHAKLKSDDRRSSRRSIYDMLEMVKPCIDFNVNDEVCQLEKYSLDREINAAAVAKRIVTEAQRIFREQMKIGKKVPQTEEEWEEFAENQP